MKKTALLLAFVCTSIFSSYVLGNASDDAREDIRRQERQKEYRRQDEDRQRILNDEYKREDEQNRLRREDYKREDENR